ncbi:hypothetical protein MC7420_5420 [Coleofasciculus chthonoplastes PCC 7420]|uniref:Uncharacterized protein n=1 Tax=Coleofasciculus chthonoplastes PCC 7420 TaxID=118168 RepID=B4VPE4_9CYAN|nr:hypothetical protein MC7420_5420 [Coleofasciculus chthonoplastes PCC 7420]
MAKANFFNPISQHWFLVFCLLFLVYEGLNNSQFNVECFQTPTF